MILTDDEIAAALGISKPFLAAVRDAHAIETAVVKRLAAGVSVEPFAYTDPLFVSVRQLGGFFSASNDKVGMFTVPLYTAEAIAAAWVQALEDAIEVCNCFIGGDQISKHIRALIGGHRT